MKGVVSFKAKVLGPLLVAVVVAGGAGLASHRSLREDPQQPGRTDPLFAAADGHHELEAIEAGGASRPDGPLSGSGEKQPKRVDLYGDPLPEGAIARLGTLRMRHDGEAWAIAFSPNGKMLAAACHNGLIYLWDTAKGKEIPRECGRSLPA